MLKIVSPEQNWYTKNGLKSLEHTLQQIDNVECVDPTNIGGLDAFENLPF